MKIRIFLLMLFTLSFLESKAIFVSVSVSPWEGWDMAWRRTNDALTDANANSMIAETQNLINTYSKTKRLTGDIVATVKDVKGFGKKVFDDLTNVSTMTEKQMKSLNEFFSWNSALKGEGGESMLKLTDFYTASTQEFRDENGDLSISQSLNSLVLNDAERLRKMRLFREFRRQMRYGQKLFLDNSFEKKMLLAKESEFKAYGLMVKLNAEVFKRELKGIQANLNAIGDAQAYIVDKRTNGQNFDGTLTESEVAQLQSKLLELQSRASTYRGEAFQIFNKIRELEYYEGEDAARKFRLETAQRLAKDPDVTKD